MPKFNVGDRVRCIDVKMPHGGIKRSLVIGGEYVVTRSVSHAGGDFVYVEGVALSFFAHRFELIPAIIEAPKAPRRKKGEIRVGDIVIPSKFPELPLLFFIRDMEAYVGKEWEVTHIDPHTGYCEVDATWCWPQSALKRVIKRKKGVVAKAPEKAAVEPVKAPPKPCLRKELIARVNGDAGVCSYAIEFADGSRRFQAKDVCHARIPLQEYVDKGKKPVALALNVSGHIGVVQNPIQDMPTYDHFLDYMLNRSPFAFAFITKSVKGSKELGILMDVNKATVDEIGTAAIILRQPTEYPGSLNVWKKAIAEGCTERVAFFAMLLVHFNDEYTLAIDGNHKPINKFVPIEGLVQLIKTGPHKRGLGVYAEGKAEGFKIFKTMCGHDTYLTAEPIKGKESVEQFVERLEIVKTQGDGWNKKFIINHAGFLNLLDALKELV